MLPVLHLHYYALVVIRLAKHVIDERAVIPVLRWLFLVQEGDISDDLLAFQQVVEKIEKQRLGNLLPEDSLEADVGEGVDVFGHILLLSANVEKSPSFHKGIIMKSLFFEGKFFIETDGITGNLMAFHYLDISDRLGWPMSYAMRVNV